MDVRQFEFLSRQPSAQVAPRANFMGMPKRLLALLLANVMFWQPVWGRLLAVTGNLGLNATGLDNRSGSVLGAGVNVSAPGAQIDNRGGRIVGDRIDLSAAGLDNREQGLLAAGAQGMALRFAPTASQAQLLNSSGQIQSNGDLQVSGAWLDNSGGTLLC